MLSPIGIKKYFCKYKVVNQIACKQRFNTFIIILMTLFQRNICMNWTPFARVFKTQIYRIKGLNAEICIRYHISLNVLVAPYVYEFTMIFFCQHLFPCLDDFFQLGWNFLCLCGIWFTTLKYKSTYFVVLVTFVEALCFSIPARLTSGILLVISMWISSVSKGTLFCCKYFIDHTTSINILYNLPNEKVHLQDNSLQQKYSFSRKLPKLATKTNWLCYIIWMEQVWMNYFKTKCF